jgi:hypothetical protein
MEIVKMDTWASLNDVGDTCSALGTYLLLAMVTYNTDYNSNTGDSDDSSELS